MDTSTAIKDHITSEVQAEDVFAAGKASIRGDSKGPSASRLPAEVIEQILYSVDPETFASLVLVSRAWRFAAETPHLYAHQLSRCPSFSATHSVITGPFTDDSLLKLKRQYVLEAKRNLFVVFTRPQQTVVNVISTTTSSSGAFPYGEAFDFVFSPKAQWCLAISSSRIIVLDTASQEVVVSRELKVVRKPLSAHILFDGTRLAVLSTHHKVNIYSLSEEFPKFLSSVALDDAAHAVTLSRHGEVLAVATAGGIEVYSLADNASATDRRAVKCDRVDSLSFSDDGTMLLGTTQGSVSASTVILSAPYFADTTDQDMPHSEFISHMWTSQILFPNSSRDCSHATLLPRKLDHDANWTLTYDRVFESFRAVRTDDLRNGTTYFTGPKPKTERRRQLSKSTLVPCTLPTTTPKGELVAAGFLGSEVWLYGVPEDLDNPGVALNNLQGGQNTDDATSGSSSRPSENRQLDFERLPRWQVLVDKYRNVFATGRRIAKVPGVSHLCWARGGNGEKGLEQVRERLIAAAPGGVSAFSDLEQEEMASVDGGRLVILDFNCGPTGGQSKEVTIEVGNVEPQILEEEDTDMATEIAIVRRRTVARRDGIPRSNVASVADVLRPAGEDAPPVPSLPVSVGFGLDSTAPINLAPHEPATPSSGEGVSLEEAAEALDGPYSHTHPRSRNTLYRSATAVEANRRRTPQIPPSGVVEYRRTDGTELPHESDADNWVPPPPPYTKDAEEPLPEHLQRTLATRAFTSSTMGAIPRRPVAQQVPLSDSESTTPSIAYRRRSSADIEMLNQASSRWASQSRAGSDRSPSMVQDVMSLASSGALSQASSSPRNVSPVALMRRPMSSYEPRSSRSSMYRAALQPAFPIDTITEPPHLNTVATASLRGPPRSTSLTLSGSNLQQRLDYPLPPPPQELPPVTGPISRSPVEQLPTTSPDLSRINTAREATSLASTHNSPKSARGPSAWQLNNVQNNYDPAPSLHARRSNASPSPPPASTKSNGRRSSRFRSPFRRNTDQPRPEPPPLPDIQHQSHHLRPNTAFNVSSTSLVPRGGPTRMTTIYSVGSRASRLPHPQSRPDVPIPPDPISNATQGVNRGRRESHAGSTVIGRMARRMSRMRARSEDPRRVTGALEERGVDSGWVGRGRRRERSEAETEIWADVEDLDRLEGGRRKGDKKCVVM